MGIELAKAYIGVTADMSQAPKNIKTGAPAVENAMQGLAGSLNSILATVGIGLGISRIMSEARQAIGLASRQIDAEARVAAVIKTTGGAAGFTANELKKMASSFQEVTRVGDEAILEIQAKFLTFKQIQGDVFERGIELTLDMAAVMGTDARSAAIQMAMALEDPIRGVTRLRRAGVTFSDQQREQIALLVEQNRLMDAQGIVLEVIEGQLGGVAKAMAETDPGKIEQLGNAIGDVKEEIGKKLMPIMIKFKELSLETWRKIKIAVDTAGEAYDKVTIFTEHLLGWAKGFTPLMTSITKAFAGFVVGIGVALAAWKVYLAVLKAVAVVKSFILKLTGVGWALVIAAAVGATAVMVGLEQASKRSYDSIKDLGNAAEEAAKKFDGLATSVENALSTPRPGTEERQEELRGLLELASEIGQEVRAITQQILEGDEQGGFTSERIAELDRLWGNAAGGPVEFARTVREELINVYGSVRDGLRDILSVVEEAEKTFRETDPSELWKQHEERVKKLDSALKFNLITLEIYNAAVEKSRKETPFGQGMDTAAQQIKQAQFELQAMQEGWDQATIATERFRNSLGEVGEEAKRLVEQFENVQQAMKLERTADKWKEMIKTPADKLRDDLREIRELVFSGKLTGKEATAAMTLLRERHLGKEAVSEQPLMGAGMVGVGQFGQQIQAAMLQKEDPVEKAVEDQTKELKQAFVDEGPKAIVAGIKQFLGLA